MNNELRYCQHYICRCDAAADLAWMSDRLCRNDLLRAAVEVFTSTVRCRIQPRKGPIRAPLPPRRQ